MAPGEAWMNCFSWDHLRTSGGIMPRMRLRTCTGMSMLFIAALPLGF